MADLIFWKEGFDGRGSIASFPTTPRTFSKDIIKYEKAGFNVVGFSVKGENNVELLVQD